MINLHDLISEAVFSTKNIIQYISDWGSSHAVVRIVILYRSF